MKGQVLSTSLPGLINFSLSEEEPQYPKIIWVDDEKLMDGQETQTLCHLSCLFSLGKPFSTWKGIEVRNSCWARERERDSLPPFFTVFNRFIRNYEMPVVSGGILKITLDQFVLVRLHTENFRPLHQTIIGSPRGEMYHACLSAVISCDRMCEYVPG